MRVFIGLQQNWALNSQALGAHSGISQGWEAFINDLYLTFFMVGIRILLYMRLMFKEGQIAELRLRLFELFNINVAKV